MWLSIISIFLVFFLPVTSFAWEGVIGENPGLDFYSRLDDAAGSIAGSIARKRIAEYSTFAGFGKYCRNSSPWFDSEPMDQRILNEVWVWNYASLSAIAVNKRVTLSSQSLQNLADCLRDAYKKIQESAFNQYESLSSVGSMGIFMDGDTANSDYDIISDIERINTLIFAENSKYDGTKNSGKTSLSNLLAGRIVAPLIDTATRTELNNIIGSSGASTTDTVPWTNIWGTVTPTLTDIGIGNLCTTNNQVTSVDNMMDDIFIAELANTLWGKDTNGLGGGTYSPRDRYTNGASSASWWTTGQTPTSKGDFFNDSRCDSIFCVKVRMVSGTDNLLVWANNASIESILDKHIPLLDPISRKSQGLEKMTTNIGEAPCVGISCKLTSMIKWGGVFLSQKASPKENYKSEETRAEKDRRFEEIRRCAAYSAGFTTSDPAKMNGVAWAWFIQRMGGSTENVTNTLLRLDATNPEDVAALANCKSIAMENGRKAYYESFSNDLSEIQVFTADLTQKIWALIDDGKKIKTLKVY